MDSRKDQMKKFQKLVLPIWHNLGVWLINIVFFAVLSITSEYFLTSTNIINVIRQISVNGIIALGATFVVLGGEIDLSQGPLVAFLGCTSAKLMVESGMNYIVAIIVTVLIGIAIGTVTGLVVSLLNVPSFITTLGIQYAFTGIVLLVTNSHPISGLPSSFMVLGRGYVGPVPVPTIILALMYVIGAIILRYTEFGRSVLAVGENAKAAELSGINVPRIRTLIFSIAGLCTGLGAVVLASRLGSGQPSSGSGASLQALAAVFVGGTSGGNVTNTLAGVLLIGLINNGLNLLAVDSAWQDVSLGLIIVGAVALDMYKTKRAAMSVS